MDFFIYETEKRQLVEKMNELHVKTQIIKSQFI